MSVVEYIFSAAHQCITCGQLNGAPYRLDTISDGVLRIIQVLIDAGAVVNNDVLFHCRSTKTLKFAINNCRCDVNHRDFYGRPVLSYYARALFDVKPSDDENGRIIDCYIDMINYLLRNGADLTIKDNGGLDVIQVVRSFVTNWEYRVSVKRWERLNAIFLEHSYRRPETPVAQAPIVTKIPAEMPVVASAPVMAPATAVVMYRSETCITCNEKPPEMWFNTSCGHMCVCAECFARLPSSSTGTRSCPVCRVDVSSYVEVKNT